MQLYMEHVMGGTYQQYVVRSGKIHTITSVHSMHLGHQHNTLTCCMHQLLCITV